MKLRVLVPVFGVLVVASGAVNAAPQMAAPKQQTIPETKRHFGAHQGTFVLYDLKRNVVKRYNPQRAAQRFAPMSTFKILNSLIAVETGVVSGENHRFPWDGKPRYLKGWEKDYNLRGAFADSVVPIFQGIARKIGPTRMQKYVRAANYGNNNTSGPIDRFWLNSTLQISANEQANFLRRLVRNELPFKPRSMNVVKDIMIRDRRGGAVLRCKTGTSGSPSAGKLGWFVGYLTRPNGEVYVFATNISGPPTSNGFKARDITEAILHGRGLW